MKLTENNKQFKLDGEVECSACEGTGLYKGLAEKDGARVICSRCDGQGKVVIKISWNKFKKRKLEKGAKRVYVSSMGYMITDKDVTTKEGSLMPFSQYGCSYKEWLKGTKPKPLEFLGCPYLHTNQDLQCKDKNNLYKTRCEDGLSVGGNISNCKFYKDKVTCWKIFKK